MVSEDTGKPEDRVVPTITISTRYDLKVGEDMSVTRRDPDDKDTSTMPEMVHVCLDPHRPDHKVAKFVRYVKSDSNGMVKPGAIAQALVELGMEIVVSFGCMSMPVTPTGVDISGVVPAGQA
jgi:hypothetical protein